MIKFSLLFFSGCLACAPTLFAADAPSSSTPAPAAAPQSFQAGTNAESKEVVQVSGTNGVTYHFTFDTSAAPDLAEWTSKNLVPVVKEWYPKLVSLLPSPGFEPLTN